MWVLQSDFEIWEPSVFEKVKNIWDFQGKTDEMWRGKEKVKNQTHQKLSKIRWQWIQEGCRVKQHKMEEISDPTFWYQLM